MGESGRRPSAELPEWQQYEPGALIEGQEGEQGIRLPDGKFYRFRHGESFVAVKSDDGSERKPMIIDANGNQIPIKEWVEQQESVEE